MTGASGWLVGGCGALEEFQFRPSLSLLPAWAPLNRRNDPHSKFRTRENYQHLHAHYHPAPWQRGFRQSAINDCSQTLIPKTGNMWWKCLLFTGSGKPRLNLNIICKSSQTTPRPNVPKKRMEKERGRIIWTLSPSMCQGWCSHKPVYSFPLSAIMP